jgi:radical SAM superfamily enzyme YgiQ (UPF0313 family)
VKVVYFQPRLQAGRHYRNGAGDEQVWAPWWALLLHQHAETATRPAVLVDARLDENWQRVLATELGPGAVLACSVMTGHAISDAVEASRLARQAGAVVVWGGPHPTLFADEVAAEPFVDHVVRGFGALPFARVLADLRAGRPVPAVVDGRGRAGPTPVTVHGGPVPSVAFDPALGLVPDWGRYVNADQALGERAVNIVTSEGCLRRCTFCSEPQTSGRSWLTYDVAGCAAAARRVIDAADAGALKLHDPNFLHDVSRGLAFAEALTTRRPVPWAATMHPADLLAVADRDLARLASFGLRRVLVGLESPVPAVVKLAGKAYDPGRIGELARKLDSHGIAGMFTFIVGWPGAHASHYPATIEAAFAVRAVSARHQAKIHFLEPWPGTPMFTLLTRTAPRRPRTLLEWARIDYYFASLPGVHDPAWESRIRTANQELSPYVEA